MDSKTKRQIKTNNLSQIILGILFIIGLKKLSLFYKN